MEGWYHASIARSLTKADSLSAGRMSPRAARGACNGMILCLATIGERHETSPPHILASGRSCCRAVGRVGDRTGTDLSDAAGALDRAVRTSRRDRHYRAAHRAMVVGAAGAAIRH